MLRRGNDAADFYANMGRSLHKDITQCISDTKTMYMQAKNWSLWLGHASYLQYCKEWQGCDHDLRPKNQHKSKGARQDVKVPREARVIRRMPWARTSLGTIEYTEDLWVSPLSSSPLCGSPLGSSPLDEDLTHTPSRADSLYDGIIGAVRASGKLVERAYVDVFNRAVGKKRASPGARFLPRHLDLEMSDGLPTHAAMGHHMMTVGLRPKQYFWCDLCSAYTSQRAQKLTKDCDRVVRTVPAVELLRKGCDPCTGANLDTKPRRLCKRDVGTRLWSGEGQPDDNLSWLSCSSPSFDNALHSVCAGVVLTHQDAYEDGQFE